MGTGKERASTEIPGGSGFSRNKLKTVLHLALIPGAGDQSNFAQVAMLAL